MKVLEEMLKVVREFHEQDISTRKNKYYTRGLEEDGEVQHE